LLPAVALAYALSPLDLVPDFIPILGLLDDLLLLPALLWLAIRAIPPQVMEDARERARREPLLLHRNWPAALVFFLLWLLSAEVLCGWLLGRYASEELLGDRWAVYAGVAGLGCVAFSAWAVGRVRYDRRRRDAWRLSHPGSAAAAGAAAPAVGQGAAVAEVVAVTVVAEEQRQQQQEWASAVPGGGGGDLEEGLPPALTPPPPVLANGAGAAAAAVVVSHRRASDEGDDSGREAAVVNGRPAVPSAPAPAPASASASPSPGSKGKQRRGPTPPPLPGGGGVAVAEGRRNGRAAAAVSDADEGAPVLPKAATAPRGQQRRR
jgi:uncharacterized membrane protein YkvA (DUF1232 family)